MSRKYLLPLFVIKFGDLDYDLDTSLVYQFCLLFKNMPSFLITTGFTSHGALILKTSIPESEEGLCNGIHV